MFEVEGKFKNLEGWAPFKKTIEAENENVAKEKIYSLIGSNHKIKRNLIKIDVVKKVE